MKAWLALWTFSSATFAQNVVTVRVYDYAAVEEDVLENAKHEASRVLAAAGIRMEWIECPLREEQTGPRYAACRTPMGVADMLLRIIPRSMQGERNLGRALGYAMPLTGSPPTRAYVLYDRLRERVRESRVAEHRLLGYVIAHEIAHLLLIDESHSRRGVMMAHWSERELVQIESGSMGFSSEERASLQAGAMARYAP
jgi:hypothetical protein